jgi:ABC-type multidrug transport system fused ATPase/permease subunit
MALKNMVGITADNYFLLFLFSLALLFFMFRSLFIVYSQYIQNKFVFYVSEYIGQKTYSYYMNMEYQQFQKLDSNFVVRELAVNPEQFVRFVMMPLLLVISELFMMILIVGGIAFYNFNVFVLICTTIFPVAMLFQRVVKKRVSSYGIEKNEQQLKLFNNSNRGVYGYVDAKLLHRERRMIEDFKKVAAIVNGINVKNSTVSIIPAKLFELVTFIGLFIIFLYAFFYSNQPASVIPLIAVYAGAGYRVVPSLSKLVPAFMTIEQYSYLFKTYTEPLKSKDENPDNDDINRQIVFKKSISLKNIALKFDDEKEVLHNFNITINKEKQLELLVNRVVAKPL